MVAAKAQNQYDWLSSPFRKKSEIDTIRFIAIQ